ncbi:MAG: DUF1501 domain-containing protein [Phycisphaerales bacterium]|nr:DUF1501 domain-containing protein [Phycisphaerales bacterium]
MSQDCNACHEYQMLNRRRFLGVSGLAGLSALAAPAWLPRVAFASSHISGRDVIVSIYLRGAADGLTLVPPFGDPAYYTLRPTLAIPRPDDLANPNPRAIDLNGYFGLAPAMAPLLEAYQAGTFAIVHAAGSPDSSRSHFDAQRFMEVGKPRDPSLYTGWLGRHLITANQADPNAVARAIGIGYQLQMTLQGGPKSLPIPDLTNYGLTGPSGTRTARLNYLNTAYAAATDPLRASAANTYNTISVLNSINFGSYVPQGGAAYSNSSFQRALRTTAALIKADVGVEAVAIDRGGWDTHSAQGNLVGGSLYGTMTDLATGLQAFHRDIVQQNWNVTVVVMSEFGRTAAENDSLGTDHGHGGVMFLMGRNINGGLVHGTWPTLSSLYQNQDLHVTTDFRDVLAEVVALRLGNNANLSTVFPGYTPTFRGLTT